MTIEEMEDKKYFLVTSLALVVAAFLLLQCPDAFGAEQSSPGRRLWDNIMLWVNFGILLFFFLKYARKPLIDYLRGVRNGIEEEIDVVNSQHKGVKSAMDSESDKIKDIEERISEIYRRAVEMGRQEKAKIIEQAKIGAEKTIQDAKTYSIYRMEMAKKALCDEMVDIAIFMVEEKLAKGISEEDNDKLINQFVTELDASKPHFI